MASSKPWFSLLRSSIVRSNLRNAPKHNCPVRASYCSSASLNHPWPEWVAFVDRLKSKGYFPSDTDTPRFESDSAWDADSKLRNSAGLAFARHRVDLFESLSLLDIQVLVEKTCPTLFRKVVDSAKRLRAHVHLDERKVCGVCNQRGRCTKYFEILDEDEVAARTVDVVRILLVYVLDPAALGKVTMSSDREMIVKSVRRLFSQLIELSDTLPAPEIPVAPMPAPRVKRKKPTFDENDWKCSRCNFMNFARNIRCRKCQLDNPKCIDKSVEMKSGDWICPGCGFLHNARKTSCYRCAETRPPIQLKSGEWECSSCGYVNWRQANSCKKCDLYCPRSARTMS